MQQRQGWQGCRSRRGKKLPLAGNIKSYKKARETNAVSPGHCKQLVWVDHAGGEASSGGTVLMGGAIKAAGRVVATGMASGKLRLARRGKATEDGRMWSGVADQFILERWKQWWGRQGSGSSRTGKDWTGWAGRSFFFFFNRRKIWDN